MIDYDKLSFSVKESLKNRGHTKEEISKMEPMEIFQECCIWEGLLGNYGYTLWGMVKNIKEAEIK